MKKALFALIALLLATAMLTGCMGTPVVVNHQTMVCFFAPKIYFLIICSFRGRRTLI